jgi:hypothetical protein
MIFIEDRPLRQTREPARRIAFPPTSLVGGHSTTPDEKRRSEAWSECGRFRKQIDSTQLPEPLRTGVHPSRGSTAAESHGAGRC